MFILLAGDVFARIIFMQNAKSELFIFKIYILFIISKLWCKNDVFLHKIVDGQNKRHERLHAENGKYNGGCITTCTSQSHAFD